MAFATSSPQAEETKISVLMSQIIAFVVFDTMLFVILVLVFC